MTSQFKILIILILLFGIAIALFTCKFTPPVPKAFLDSASHTATYTPTASPTSTQTATSIYSPTATFTQTTTATPSSTATATPTSTTTASPTPTPTEEKTLLGPDLEDFPPGYNPLTGLPVSDPANLHLPALLISITNFPPSARPQGGLSFAPYVFELFIGEGMTRFLALFYGEYPKHEDPPIGNCPVREEPFVQTGTILGNYAWSDNNANGIQDVGERGIAGVCVHLYDADADELLDTTSTDSNGYYGFNVDPNRKYYIVFDEPQELVFIIQDAGDDDREDSDADPSTGKTSTISLSADDHRWDAGFIPGEGNGGGNGNGNGNGNGGNGNGNGNGGNGKNGNGGGVGPIRSGRLPYKYIGNWFHKACLIFAGSSYDVPISGCASVFGTDKSDINSAFLAIDRMIAIAKQAAGIDEMLHYTGNLFLNLPPSGGQYKGPLVPKEQPLTKPESPDLKIGDDELRPAEVGGANPPPVSAGEARSIERDNVAHIDSGVTSPQENIEGEDAQEVLIFYNFYNQSLWRFDPLSGGYLRYTDNADGSGEFYPASDRLNGRQLIFHNVIIIFANHTAIKPTIIDIELEFAQGPAILFRDGKAYHILWSTLAGEYEQETGQQRPIKYIDLEGNLIPLHPGQSWVHIVTMNTSAWEVEPGKWKVRFYSPPGTQ